MKAEVILSIVATFCAIIALFQTYWQIMKSNKQSLFDRRLKLFLEFKSLCDLYGDDRSFLDLSVNGNIDMIEVSFSMLTNSIYLEECYEAFKTPLENPGHKILLKKREELREKSVQAGLIFKKSYSLIVSEFIELYEQLLYKLYQYKIAIENKDNTSLEAYKELCKHYYNQLGFKEIIEKMNLLYREIESKKIIKKIKNDINFL